MSPCGLIKNSYELEKSSTKFEQKVRKVRLANEIKQMRRIDYMRQDWIEKNSPSALKPTSYKLG